MKIISAKPRKDGKVLVTLLFTSPDSSRSLRKVLSREQYDAAVRRQSAESKPRFETGFEPGGDFDYSMNA